MNGTAFIIIFSIMIVCQIVLLVSMRDFKSPKTYEVFVHDVYYDYMTNNGYPEDYIPTIVNVKYNDRGEILKVEMADTTSDLCDCVSPACKLQHFYNTCKIYPHRGLDEYKKYTIWGKIIK